MPFIFIVPVCIMIFVYIIFKKINLKTETKRILQISVCTIVWISMFYQFVSIAHYIDDSGEKFVNVLGNHGLDLSWIGLVLFTVYVMYIYIDYFGNIIKK